MIGSAAALTAIAGFFGGDEEAFAAGGAATLPFALPDGGVPAATVVLGIAGLAVALKALSGARFSASTRASAVIQLALGGSVLALGARSLIENPSAPVGVAAVLAGAGAVWTATALAAHWYHSP